MQGWGACCYHTPGEVLEEVRRVWANCCLYNPPGEPILCAKIILPLVFQH